MPDEPIDNDQQPEPTPHFDEFSEHNKTELPSEPTHTPRPLNEPTPVQNGPMTSFTPEPKVDPGLTRAPDAQPIQPLTLAGGSNKPKWFKSKKFIIGLIAVILVVLIAGGSVFAYISYYQNPQKVISDSIINAFTSKTAIYTGTIGVENSDIKVNVEITSKIADATGSLDAKMTVTANSKTYTVNGSALVDKSGDIYFKAQNLTGIVVEAKTSMGIAQSSSISTAVDKLVAKIDGTWIKISSDDLKQYSSEASTSKTCINDTIKKFKDDKSAINEVTNLYSKHQFIIVDKDLGQVDSSFGYQIKGSNAELKGFLDGLKDTKIYKSLHDCDKSFVIDTKDMSIKDETNKNSTLKLWVDVWSHQITKVEVNSKDLGTTFAATVIPKYNQTVTITTPKTSITLTQLQTYIQDLFTTLQDGNQL